MKKKILAGVLAVLFVFSAALLGACGSNSTDESKPAESVPATSGEPVDESSAEEKPSRPLPDPNKSYTLNEFISASPLDWNPHSWETNADNYFAGYCEMGFVDVTIADDGINFEWVYEMATDVTDITKDFADKEKWKIPSDAEAEYVYKITLNPDAKWQDGTPINADTYIESMKRMLDPKMQNYRANSYTSGAIAIRNAAKYFGAEQPIYAVVVPDYGEGEEPDYSFDITSQPVYFKFDTTTWTFSHDYTFNELAVDYGGATNIEGGFQGEDVYNNFKKKANYLGYIEIKPEDMEDAKQLVGQILGLFGLSYSDEIFKEALFYNTGNFSEAFDFAGVGLIKTGEYELTYINQDPCDEFNFLVNLTGNWIVKLDLYDAGKKQEGELVATNYGTSAETYASYGPYKLTSFQKDKLFVMEKNDQWYGWNDGKHVGEYWTTSIRCSVIPDHSTALLEFQKGNLDSIDLESTDMPTYKMSDYLLKTDQTYTYRYIFATDINALKALETGTDVNKRILSYRDFRKAISLAINRADFARQATPAYKPAYYLFNYLYYYNIANDTESIYRNTDEARNAVLRLYGIEYGEGKDYATAEEAYDAVTGYDVEEAKKLFTAAYEAAKADGNYTDGQKIVINCMCSAATTLAADDTKQQDLLNQYCAAATVGTPLEGKIEFVFKCGANKRYEDVANGKIEMIRGAWGGAAFYPFSTIRVYTEPAYMGGISAIHESCGWDPTLAKCSITADFYGTGETKTMEKTLQDWAILLNGDLTDEDDNVIEKAFSNPEAKLAVLSALEYEVLNAYQCIPFAAETAATLFSKKIEYATLDYNIMYGYGGIRLMTYKYDDEAWAKYVADNGGTLSYE